MEKRWDKHIQDALAERDEFHFHRAIRKYGPENFTHKIVKTCPKVLLNKWETHYIAEYDTFRNGYNMTMGGEGGDLCQESREKISKSIIDYHMVKNGKPGNIYKRSRGTFMARYCGKNIGSFTTEQDAIDALWAKHHGEEIKNARSRNGKGSVRRYKNRWRAVSSKGKHLGMYASEEEARDAIIKYKHSQA